MGKVYHSKYMPGEREKVCAWCRYFTLDNRGKNAGYADCVKRNRRGIDTYLNDHCSSFDRAEGRTRADVEDFLTWHISTMIGLILGKDLQTKPFSSIKLLKEYSSNDEAKNKFVKLYDIYGELISTGLYFDPNRVNVSEAMLPILNKVSDLVDSNNYDEAFNSYYQMVMMLYTRYNHSLVNNSEFDYHNEALNLEEKPKMLIKK